jgi:ATP-dependent Zn protease
MTDEAEEREENLEDQTATAYHEAGHAVLALYLGRPVHRVSILPNQLRLGQVELTRGMARPPKDFVEDESIFLLAGMVAEARHTGAYSHGHAGADLRAVRELIATRAATERQAEKLERRFLDKTEYLLDDPALWMAVELLVAELLAKKTVSGRAAKHFYELAERKAEKEA